MGVYSYTATDVGQRSLVGTLIADTPAEGRQQLRERGLSILSFGTVRHHAPTVRCVSRSRRRDQVAELARHLSLLLRSDVPLTTALQVLRRQQSGKLSDVLATIGDRITGGETLADTLADHSDWFDALFVSAVRTGELSGQLDEALTDLAEHLQSERALKARLSAALTYPLILLVVGIGVVLFLMSFVVPQLLSVLTASGKPLPASTMLLKGLSDALVAHWLILLLGVVAAIVAAGALYRKPNLRRAWQTLWLRIPLVGPLVRKGLIAQFAQQMTLLLKTGIPFVEAVRSVSEQTSNVVLSEELAAMARAVESGSDIAPTMNESRIFPPVVRHLVAVGQESGELTTMLAELRVRYQDEVRLATSRFAAALEPLLIVVMAAGVGFVVFACLMPILEATRGIG